MAFRASNIVPQQAYQMVKSAAVQLKTNLNAMIAQLAGAPASYEFLRDIYRTLSRAQGQFSALAATPGLVAHAKTQEDDQTYDVVAEFNSMQGAITGATVWMDANVPTAVTVSAPSAWGDGAMISTTFTPEETAPLRSALQAVVATIS